MTLLNEAYLELEAGDGSVGVFEFQHGLKFSGESEKAYTIGNQGSSIREIDRFIPEADLGLGESPRRTAYWFDGGSGIWAEEISAEINKDDILWGDGAGGSGAANVTKSDASGEGVAPISRYQVLEYWLARTRSDSFGHCRLHWGEWTDGSVGDSSGGVFETAMPIAIRSWSPTRGPDDPSAIELSLSVVHVALFPADEEKSTQWALDNLNLRSALTVPAYVPDQ